MFCGAIKRKNKIIINALQIYKGLKNRKEKFSRFLNLEAIISIVHSDSGTLSEITA
ncbi:hypothetical protein C900_01706 [Fulvivirga imtechensis AK7]|uniref:Uncharacterized protein n=1 Tax=Fulvivirga imtechensis AK7 TaxID=1237149 RepID=L8JTJ3_9BACT|nr:hypothetical protein C900_01706 [Fulvivirga imtechensis AK7]